MAADTIMVDITEMDTIIIVDRDIVVDTTITMDIVTIKDDATKLKMVDMDTTTVEIIIRNRLITDLDVADNNEKIVSVFA